MDVITQAGIASEYFRNGAFILLPEITWYCFTHAQVELKQLAKPEATWEAERPSQDHPDSTSMEKSSSTPSHMARTQCLCALLAPQGPTW